MAEPPQTVKKIETNPPAVYKKTQPEATAMPEARKAYERSLDELQDLMRETKKAKAACATPISNMDREMLQELFGLLGIAPGKTALSSFLNRTAFDLHEKFSELPALSAGARKALEAFLGLSGIRLLDQKDVEKLARGETFIIGGIVRNFSQSGQKKSREQIEKLQTDYGIYVGIYPDGRAYISNKAGWLIQQLANDGISIELYPDKTVNIINNNYAPRNMPASVLKKIDDSIKKARQFLDKNNFEEAIRIIKIIQKIIQNYQVSENMQAFIDGISEFDTIKLNTREWAFIKGEFSDNQFQEMTGLSFNEFENEMKLSLGGLAKIHAKRAQSLLIKIAETYVRVLEKIYDNADPEEIKKVEQLGEKAEAIASRLASSSMITANTIMKELPLITDAILEKEQVAGTEIPEELLIAHPEIKTPLEAMIKSEAGTLPEIESNLKYRMFYSLGIAACDQGSYAMAAMEKKIIALEKEEKRLRDASKKAREDYGQTVKNNQTRINFECDVAFRKAKLSILRQAIDDPYLTVAEKDLVKIALERALPITPQEAAKFLDNCYSNGNIDTDSPDGKKYSDIKRAIDIAYPFAWRYRLYKFGRNYGIEGIYASFETLYKIAESGLFEKDPQLKRNMDYLKQTMDRIRKSSDELNQGDAAELLKLIPGILAASIRLKKIIPPQIITREKYIGHGGFGELAHTEVREKNLTLRFDESLEEFELLLKRNYYNLDEYSEMLSDIANDAKRAAERLKMLLPPERKKEQVTVSTAAGASGTSELLHRNATAIMEDELAELEKDTGEIKKLNRPQFNKFMKKYGSVYENACTGMAEEIEDKEFGDWIKSIRAKEEKEDREFEDRVKSLPISRRVALRSARFLSRGMRSGSRVLLLRSARFLDKNGETIMDVAAVAGVVAGVLDSAGAGSVPEGAALRVAAGAGIKSVVKRYGAALPRYGLALAKKYGSAMARGAFGNYALSAKILAPTVAAQSGLIYLLGETEKETEESKRLFLRSVQFSAQGLMNSAPFGISPKIYGLIGIPSSAIFFGGTAFDVISYLNKDTHIPITPADKFKQKLEKTGFYAELLYTGMSIVPGYRFTRGFYKGMRGFREIEGTIPAWVPGKYKAISAAKAGLKSAYSDFSGAETASAFHSGDIILAGQFAADPFIKDWLERKITQLAEPREREMLELTPIRLSSEKLGQMTTRQKLVEALGEDFRGIAELKRYFEEKDGKIKDL